jgi:hypothetical protein
MDLSFLENQWVYGVLVLIVILYGSLAGPNLPPFIRNLFQNPIFQILLFSLIVYKANMNPQFALIIAVVFLIVMTLIDRQIIRDEFGKIETFNRIRF